MNKNIETRLDKLEDAIKPKGEIIRLSPEEKKLLKECARRDAQIELKYLHGKITDEEKDMLIKQTPKEAAQEIGLEKVLENLMRRVCHE